VLSGAGFFFTKEGPSEPADGIAFSPLIISQIAPEAAINCPEDVKITVIP
jgi:hypothetical protein